MSHITAIAIEIKDLAALEAATKELGAELIRNQHTYKWYGTSVGDYPLPAGFTADMLGKCEHAIRLPGNNYEIGVVRNPLKPSTFTLLYDFWGYGGQHDGHKLKAHFGDGLKKLVQLYGVHAATIAARSRGHAVARQTLPNGSIKLQIRA
jgi:hypothetical protein